MSLLKDLRYGARKLVRNPGFSAVSVLTLALGIGLTTTMFSIVYGAMFRGLPYEGGDRLVSLERNNPVRGWEHMDVSLHDFADWRQQQKSFEALGGYTGGTVNVSGTEKPERYDGAYVTANTFQILGARPALGRTFREGEDTPGSPAVVVLGHSVWRDRFKSDPAVLGKTIRVNAEQAEIIGVMPEGFGFPANEELWIPFREAPDAKRGEGASLAVFGKLREGVTLDAANVEMDAIARRLQAEYPESNKDIGANVQKFTDNFLGDEPRMLLWTMLGAVFMVLLIACANVANLLLSQAAMRAKEVGIRTALGASRARIMMQFLTEPLALAAVGAVIGVGLAWMGVRMFSDAVAATKPPTWLVFKVDGPILLFVLAITVLATLLSGVLPAIRASGSNVQDVLKDESRGSSSFRGGRISKVLVVFEIALSVALLVAAGLMVKSVTRLSGMDYGFPTDVFTARVALPETVYRDSAAQVRFFEQLYPRVAELPGVEAATITADLPGLGSGGTDFAVEGKAYAAENEYPEANLVTTMPGYFNTFRVKVDGRDFSTADRGNTLPVAIVNATFAKKHFGGENAVGRRIRLGGAKSTEPWRQIVGVVPDMWLDATDNDDPEGIYVPFSQSPRRFMSVVIRTRGEPGAMTAPVRNLVTSMDPDLPIYFVMTLQERIDEETWFYRVFGTIFMIMGFVALFLAAIGLYGVMAFNVSRRTREMGVRMALGAHPRSVVGLVLRQGLIQLGAGVVIGTAGAFFLAKLLTMLLFQVAPTDPVVFGGTLAVLIASGIAASLIPARRATRVDPMVALRYE
jgi:putative ABC transport system permease protein